MSIFREVFIKRKTTATFFCSQNGRYGEIHSVVFLSFTAISIITLEIPSDNSLTSPHSSSSPSNIEKCSRCLATCNRNTYFQTIILNPSISLYTVLFLNARDKLWLNRHNFLVLYFLCSEFKLDNIYSGVNFCGKNVCGNIYLRELIFRIAGKIAKIRTSKNFVPHGETKMFREGSPNREDEKSFRYELKQWNYTKISITSSKVCNWTRKTFCLSEYSSFFKPSTWNYWHLQGIKLVSKRLCIQTTGNPGNP